MTSQASAAIVAGERQRFELAGRLIEHPTGGEAQQLLAAAHTDRSRPMCLCTAGGVPMYVAQVGAGAGRDRFIVKRMPDTGLLHAPDCPSYLPPEILSGLGQVLGSAIREQTDTGVTALRLGFPMSKIDRAAAAGPMGSGDAAGDSVTADGARLSLRALLHYLWQEAGLATWSPAMTGKRNWRIVSWHLRQAAQGKYTKGQPLDRRLYVPEPFSSAHKTEIAARRHAAWAPARAAGRSARFMILIGEVKAIEPARFGHKLLVRHLPDAPLMLDDDLHRRLRRRFAAELELWEVDEPGHLMVIATFTVGRAGLASIQELSLVMCDQQWLPYESAIDKLLLDAAVTAGRRFTKSLRYNLPAAEPMAALVLTDTERPTGCYLLTTAADHSDVGDLQDGTGLGTWEWAIGEDMPPFPPAGRLPRAVPDRDPLRLSTPGHSSTDSGRDAPPGWPAPHA